MSFFIDLPLQDFFSARDCDSRYLATQFFACPIDLLLDLGSSCSELPLALFDAVGFAFGDNFVSPGACLVQNGRRLLARIVDDVISFSFGLVQALLAKFRGSKSVGDLRLTLFDRVHDRRPDELHAEPDEHEHRD